MATITISVPDALKSFVDIQLSTKDYGNVSAYSRALPRRMRSWRPATVGKRRPDRSRRVAAPRAARTRQFRDIVPHPRIIGKFPMDWRWIDPADTPRG
jgi:Arc/MetJ-type ribon-helix-helix transcriptional regulator